MSFKQVLAFYKPYNLKLTLFFFTFKMEEIASEMNFDEGIAMPVANLENKQLESEVRFAQGNKIDT